jgi:hypothetical protein
VTSRLSPCFAGELRILLSSLFGEKNPLGFAIFLQSDVKPLFLASRQSCFLRADIMLFLAGGCQALSPGSCLGSVSRGQLLRSVFCRWLRSGRCMAQILLSSTCMHVTTDRQETGDRAMKTASLRLLEVIVVCENTKGR